MPATAFVYGDHLQAHNPSADAERRLRRELGIALLEAYGLLDHPDVTRVEPRVATQDELTAVHAAEYVEAVRRIGADPSLATDPAERRWGFADGDTVAVPGMHEAAAAVCGAALTGALEIWEGRATQSFCPAPTGLHHALADRATGMCVYNDAAVAIQALLDRGAERIAYIDIDAHHGNGLQWIFYEDPRVLTVSVHESGRYLYPGTGHLSEMGVGPATGTSVNVPLPPLAGDSAYLEAIDRVVAPAVVRFAPDVIVSMTGLDPHHTDPMSHIQVSTAGLQRAYAKLADIAHASSGGRWLVVTGGGYNIDVLPRMWAVLLATMLGVELPDEVPPEWLAMAAARAGRDFTPTLLGDGPIAADETQRYRADEVAFETIAAARSMNGLDTVER